MSMNLWFVIFTCLSTLIATSVCPAGDKPQSFQERWQLQFFPEEMPDQRLQLNGTAWLKTGDMNILGASTDLVIRFPTGARRGTELFPFPSAGRRPENGMNSILQPVEFSSISYPGFGNEPITERTEKYRQSLIAGPCLEYGGQVHTFHVVQDKQFLFHVVVPVNPLQWYTVRVIHTDPELAGRPKPQRLFRVTEFLFEFGADPLKVDKGPLTIHYHAHDSRAETTTIQHFHRTFHKEHDRKDPPAVRRISTDFAGALLFVPEHRYALIDEGHYDAFGDETFLPLTKNVEE